MAARLAARVGTTKRPRNSSLRVFIQQNSEAILEHWERFAKGIPAARHVDAAVLRDHAGGILREIVADLQRPQTPGQQAEKSQGRGLRHQGHSQAELHGAERFTSGFSVNEAIAEFRALRASVLQLWGEANSGVALIDPHELTRFNEAIDQALTESIERFALEKDEYARRFDTLLSSSPDLHFIIGLDGRLMYANQALSKQFAVSQDQVAGSSVEALCPELAARIMDELRKVGQTCDSLRGEVCRRGIDGPDVTYRYIFLPVLNDKGQVESITGTARNISELKESEEKIHRNAYYDSLTQLPNRALFLDRLEQNVKQANRTGHPLALLYIDLDGFKEVNDRSGHAAGDQLLQESALRIASCVRGSDTVARIGGDEYTVILSEINDILHIEIVAQSILDRLAEPFAVDSLNYYVSGSMGITLCPQDGQTPAELLRNADQAMYVAKQAGRNRFSFFTAEMRNSAWARLTMIDQLRQALAQRQLEVYYQPIVDLKSGAIVKAEALVRWHHPVGSLVLPDEFIGVAEQTGLIGEIGSLVLEKAANSARQWSALLGRPFQVSVNKSAVEFMSMGMMKYWDHDLDVLEQARDQIAVEITEGILLNDSSSVRERLGILQRAGVQFAIDDFGIGYSSLSYLKKFKVDFLKIDQSFVKDMSHSADSSVFAQTIIVMAHQLGLNVIAEGVETVEQRDRLQAMGCDYAQGFFYCDAVPSERLTAMLETAPA